jgi:predicted nucleic acid-binding protein
VTVLDTSGVVDFLVGDGAFDHVASLLNREAPVAVPDLLIFEVVAVLRRQVQHRSLDPTRAQLAIEDLGDFPLEIFPSLPLRGRVWELRDNLTAADGFFVALAEQLGEPLATKDRGLALAAQGHSDVTIIDLDAPV